MKQKIHFVKKLLTKVQKPFNGAKITFSTNGAGVTRHSQAVFTPDIKRLKMDHGLKYKT